VIRWVASMPPMPGMFRSISTMSGPSSTVNLIASSPSWPCPQPGGRRHRRARSSDRSGRSDHRPRSAPHSAHGDPISEPCDRQSCRDARPPPLPAADTQRIEASPNPSRRPLFRPTPSSLTWRSSQRSLRDAHRAAGGGATGCGPPAKKDPLWTSRTWPRNRENRSPAAPA
jgi:hypothetical protein